MSNENDRRPCPGVVFVQDLMARVIVLFRNGSEAYLGSSGARRLAREFGDGLIHFVPNDVICAIRASYAEMYVPLYVTGPLKDTLHGPHMTMDEWREALEMGIEQAMRRVSSLSPMPTSDLLVEPGCVYLHYKKGARYKVVMVCKHSETKEDMVVYQSLETNEVWTRPLSMWNDVIPEDRRTEFGQAVRFKKM